MPAQNIPNVAIAYLPVVMVRSFMLLSWCWTGDSLASTNIYKLGKIVVNAVIEDDLYLRRFKILLSTKTNFTLQNYYFYAAYVFWCWCWHFHKAGFSYSPLFLLQFSHIPAAKPTANRWDAVQRKLAKDDRSAPPSPPENTELVLSGRVKRAVLEEYNQVNKSYILKRVQPGK